MESVDMTFQSLIAKFPMPIPDNFMLMEDIGTCHVEFCDYEQQFKVWSWRGPMVCFFDENDQQIATISLAGPIKNIGSIEPFPDKNCVDYFVDKSISNRRGDYCSSKQFIEFMLEEYPVIAEYLLWHL